MPEDFRNALAECFESIPAGRVATCGAVARALGDLRAARSIATWVNDHPRASGAHRIVRIDGHPVLPSAPAVLTEEGVPLHGGRVPPQWFVEALPPIGFLSSMRTLQEALARRVREEDEPSGPRTFGGVDVAYRGDHAFAAAVALDAETLEVLETSEREVEVEFPYIPTYLAFREFPAIRAAFNGLTRKPDVLFVDGHGRLHPALFGFACFAGVQLDVPTVGIAKHPLTGRVAASARVRDATPIEIDGVVRGYAWVPPSAARPFYVSVGHRISLPTALAMAQHATRGKYPEPLLLADRRSKERKAKKNAEGSTSGRHARSHPPAQGREGA